MYLWPRHKVALDGHASAKKMCKSYLKIRCLSMFEVCGRRRNKVGCAITYRFLPYLPKSNLVFLHRTFHIQVCNREYQVLPFIVLFLSILLGNYHIVKL